MNCKIIAHIKGTDIVGLVVISFLMWLTVKNVDVCWGTAETLLLRSLPTLGIVALSVWMAAGTRSAQYSVQDVLVILWMTYCFVRAFAGNEYPCASQVLRDMGFFALYFILRTLLSCGNIPPCVLIGMIVIGGCYEGLLGLSQIIYGTGRHYLYQLTGSFLNPGPYSAYPLMALVVGLTAKEKLLGLASKVSETARIHFEYVYLSCMMLLAFVVIVTWSRAAIVSFVLVALCFYKKHYWSHRYIVWIATGSCCLLLYFLKQGSADGRLLTWTAALTTWLHCPWVGVGIGGFHNACAEGMAELYAANADNLLFASGNVAEYAFCDFIKVLVEQGIVGGLFCAATSIVVLYNVYGWSRPLFYGMISLVIFSLASYPFELHPYRIVVVLLAAATQTWRVPIAVGSLRKPLVGFLLLGLTAVTLVVAKESKKRFLAQSEAWMLGGRQNVAFVNDFYKILPVESDNAQFLFDFARTLRDAGRYNDSNAMLRQGSLVSGDPMFYVLQGNNYKDLACPGLAETAYLKAHAVMPNRMYALYQLLLLYQSTNQAEKARSIAGRILRMSPKVSSPATEEIINKAKKCI